MLSFTTNLKPQLTTLHGKWYEGCLCSECSTGRLKMLALLNDGKELDKIVYDRLRGVYQRSLWLMSIELCGVPLRPIQKLICDFFIAKDPNKPFEKQSDIHERLLLFPRRGWKTTIDALDCVNWMICFPLITIAIQTGDADLAEAIVGLIKSYFLVPGWDGERDGNGLPIWNLEARPTKLNRLFPEHSVTETGDDKGAKDCFVTPARKIENCNPKHRYIKDPTVYALSIESNNSGWRCDVMKNDDILTDNNIRTPQRISTIDRRFHMSRKLLAVGIGYRDTIGTRYFADDTYGRLMGKMGLKDENIYGEIEIPGKFKYLNYPAWWQKGTGPDGDGELNNKFLPPSKDGKKEYYDFLDEELWPFEGLMEDLTLDSESHASQYLNNPTLTTEVSFTRDGLLGCVRQWTQMPLYAKTFAIVDLAYSDKRGRDFTVIAIGSWYNDALWIKDIIRGRFSAEEMPETIVGAVRDYPEIEVMGIEESVGAKWLKTDIFSAAERQGIVMPTIDWISLGQGEKDAKDNRINGLVPLYKSNRLLFLDNMRISFDEVMKEFISTRGKRDIPDAISRLRNYQARGETPETKQEQIEHRQKIREQESYDQIFGQGRYAYTPPPAEPELVEEELEPEVKYDETTGLPMGDFYGSVRG